MQLLLRLRSLRWALEKRWVGIGTVVGALATGGLTLVVCYAIAKDQGHTTEDVPSISSTGDKMPEHAVFVVGFVLLSLLTSLGMLLRAAHLECFITERGSCLVSALNLMLLLVGWCHAPALVVMAAIGESSSQGDVHLTAALVGLGSLAAYGILQAIFSSVVRFKHASWLRLAEALWCLPWVVISPIMICLWRSTTDNVYEWMGVILLFPYFLVFLVEFWLAPKDLEDKVQRKDRSGYDMVPV